jgi:hypothetical protein
VKCNSLWISLVKQALKSAQKRVYKVIALQSTFVSLHKPVIRKEMICRHKRKEMITSARNQEYR